MDHPHPDKRHVMVAYRRYILGEKKRGRRARSLVHYHDLVQTYLTCKRLVLKEKAIAKQVKEVILVLEAQNFFARYGRPSGCGVAGCPEPPTCILIHTRMLEYIKTCDKHKQSWLAIDWKEIE